MAPKRKRAAAEGGGGEEAAAADAALRTELAGLSTEDVAREWLARRAELKGNLERMSGLRKSIKSINKILAERMMQERVESVSVDDETLVRSKDVTLAKD